MAAKPESHSIYFRGNELVAEWYDFGDHAPYESANLLVLDPPAQRALAIGLALEPMADPDRLAAAVAQSFQSWFEFRGFLARHDIEAQRETDFMP